MADKKQRQRRTTSIRITDGKSVVEHEGQAVDLATAAKFLRDRGEPGAFEVVRVLGVVTLTPPSETRLKLEIS